MKWHFDDGAAIERLHAAATELEGTPFVKFSRAVGRRGGIDCVGAAEFLMWRSGVIAHDEFQFARTADDYQGHTTVRKILRYLRGTADDPQSLRLAQLFASVALFRELRRVVTTGDNIDETLFMPGDLLVIRHRDLFHLPVMLTQRQFISAVPHVGAVVTDLHDRPFYSHPRTKRLHLVACFRARGNREALQS